MPAVLQRVEDEDGHRVQELDKDCKEKFKWSWMETKVDINISNCGQEETKTFKLGDFFDKVDTPGMVVCRNCNNQSIKYSDRGRTSLKDHTKSKKHRKNLEAVQATHAISSHFAPLAPWEPQSIGEVPSAKSVDQEKLAVPALMCDRVSTSELEHGHISNEAMVLAFVAEHSLPFALVPEIVQLTSTLADDKKALNNVKLSRTTSSYKVVHGIGKHFRDETVANLRKYAFSLNIDESTSNNNKRVLAILVTYYDPEKGKVVVEHLASTELIKVNAESVYKKIEAVFEENAIPWENLVSVLLDSCRVMRGTKSGLEARLRNEKVPSLLDIDGDSCHHIHNCAKQFCRPFEDWLERLLADLHNDHKWSADLKDYLAQLCEILGISFTVPGNYIPHRWLSVYDVALDLKAKIKAYQVFYYAFLPKNVQPDYLEVINQILSTCSIEARKQVRSIHKALAEKKLTEDGKKRKDRIVLKLLIQDKKTLLILNLYLAVLPILKSYVCIFQNSGTLVHKLHDKQLEVFMQFLACFVKPEHLVNKGPLELKKMDLTENGGNLLKVKHMFVGGENEELLDSLHSNDSLKQEFQQNAAATYMSCGQYMAAKLPLSSPVLQSLSCLDPMVRSHSTATVGVKRLVREFGFVRFLSDDGRIKFCEEWKNLQSDSYLPRYSDGTDDAVSWWTTVMKTGKYPNVSRVVAAGLAIFHGPQVESSFSTMNDLIDPKSNRLEVSTYSAIQCVKYGLRSKDTSAIQYLKRKDPLYSPVNKRLCLALRSAASQYIAKKQAAASNKRERLKKLKLSVEKPKSKEQTRVAHELKEKNARLEHHRREKRLKMKRTLEDLAAKRSLKKKRL